MTSQPSRQQTEDALMEALEAWASSLGDVIHRTDGARYYPTRSIPPLREAHANERLLDEMTDWLPAYRGLRHDQASANRMVEIVKAGKQPWEHLLLESDRPWSAYVTTQQRAVLHQVLADCHAAAAGQQLRLRAKLQAAP